MYLHHTHTHSHTHTHTLAWAAHFHTLPESAAGYWRARRWTSWRFDYVRLLQELKLQVEREDEEVEGEACSMYIHWYFCWTCSCFSSRKKKLFFFFSLLAVSDSDCFLRPWHSRSCCAAAVLVNGTYTVLAALKSSEPKNIFRANAKKKYSPLSLIYCLLQKTIHLKQCRTIGTVTVCAPACCLSSLSGSDALAVFV